LKLSRKAHILVQALTTAAAAYTSALIAIYAPPVIAVPSIGLVGAVASAVVTYLSTNGQ
jgi:hypothetical protein